MMSPELGRFLQTDPIGFQGDASNLYRYCGNDPVDRSDPTGTEYQVVVVDSTHVTINIPIVWKGAGNSTANQAAFTSGIEKRWSVTWGGTTVTTKVTDGLKVDKALANTVYIRDGKDTSTVVGGRQGTWYVGYGNLEGIGAHEAGHFLGLGDGYQKINQWYAKYLNGCPVPKDGYDWDNIMVNKDGTPDSRDISRILGGDGTGYRGWGASAAGNGHGGGRLDAYGSSTGAAAAWERSWGYGGWLAGERKLGR